MKQRTALIATTILSALTIHTAAQIKNYTPGKIITLQGDTLNGSINNARWFTSPKVVEFKTADGKEVLYTASEINGFVIDGSLAYLSYAVNYDSSRINPDELPGSSAPAFKKDQLFLRLIVKSNLSLLVWQEPGREHLFLQKNGQVEELILHRYKTGGQVLENRYYLQQLKNYLGDCSSLTINPNAPYTEDYIKKLVIKYNTCKNSSGQTFAKEKTLVRPGIVLISAYDQYQPSFDGGIGYGAGAFMNFNFPNKNYSTSLYTEVAYRKTADQLGKTTDEVYKVQSIQWSTVFLFRPLAKLKGLMTDGGISLSGGLPDEYRRTSRQNISGEQTQIFTSILGDVNYMATENLMISILFESGDSISMQDSDFGNVSMNRSTSLRLSLGWQF